MLGMYVPGGLDHNQLMRDFCSIKTIRSYTESWELATIAKGEQTSALFFTFGLSFDCEKKTMLML